MLVGALSARSPRDRYLVTGLDNARNTYRFSEGSDPREFSPNALTYEVR
jgi:hypothetical protein